MLEEFTTAVITKTLEQNYSHLKQPAVLHARVTQAAQLGTVFEYDVQVTNADAGTSFNAKITGHWYEYSVRILDKSGGVSDDYPEIPGVKSKVQAAVGATVAVALAYGDLNPVILGEVIA